MMEEVNSNDLGSKKAGKNFESLWQKRDPWKLFKIASVWCLN